LLPTPDLQGASVYPLKLSPDGTYVTDRAGQPFFMNGDTAWSLIAQLSRVNADRYLSDRAATGFNTMLVNLLEHRFANHAPSNRAGEPPFARPGDFTAPNLAYFASADWMIARAGERGILVLLNALYLGYDCGNEGWCAEVKASSPAALQKFGRYLGTRYRNVPNIVWVIGGDTDPVANGVVRLCARSSPASARPTRPTCSPPITDPTNRRWTCGPPNRGWG
jgi:hypothetical protein